MESALSVHRLADSRDELANPQVTIAGVPGTTLWSGSAPGLITGAAQVNVQLPSALPGGTRLQAVPVVPGLGPDLSPPVLMGVKE